MRPRLRMWRGSKLSLTRAASAASGAGIGSKTGTAPRSPGAVLGACDRSPEEAAAPVEIPRGIEIRGDRLGDLGAARRSHREAPDGALAEAGERPGVADRPPQPGRGLAFEDGRAATGANLGEQPVAAEGDRGRRPFEPQQGEGRAAREGRRQIGRARDLVRRRERLIEAGDGRRRGEPGQDHAQRLLRLRQDLDRHLLQGRQRAERPRQQFRQIVAGDILDHLAARLERLAAAADRAEAEKMVARRPRPDAARSRQVAGDDAAERAPRRRSRAEPVERPPIGRLESQHLMRLAERGFDLGKRGRRGGGQHEFARLVVADAREARQVETMRQLQGPAEAALGAAGDKFKRLPGRERLGDRIAQLGEVGGDEAGHSRRVAHIRALSPGDRSRRKRRDGPTRARRCARKKGSGPIP
jgi:hypothetical protein